MLWRWRSDEEGAWHHVMNRGLARRSVFEDRECVRYFLSCLARIVRRGLLEVPHWNLALHPSCLSTCLRLSTHRGHERAGRGAPPIQDLRPRSPLDDLICAAHERIGQWMRRKAELADGIRPGIPCASPTAVLCCWERRALADPEWRLPRGRSRVEVWPAALVGLLRDVAGLSWAEIQRRADASASGVQRRYQNHRIWMGQGGPTWR